MDLFTEMLMKILFVCVDALRPSQHQQTKKEARESNHSCMWQCLDQLYIAYQIS